MLYGKLTQGIETALPGSMTQSEGSIDSPSLVYTTYEELPNFFGKETNFEDIFHKLIDGTKDKLDWKAHFDVVENLRILNKYHNAVLLNKISLLISFWHASIDSLRSNLSKNALLLLKEIIHKSPENAPSEEVILKLLPLVLDKAVSDKGFIKNEAKNVLKEIEKNGCWDVTIYILGERCFDKNANVCELSMMTLLEIIKNVKENLTYKLTKNGLKILWKTMARNLEGKRASLKRMSEEAIRNVAGFVTKNGSLEDYLKLEMELTLPEIQLIQASLQDKKNKQTKGELLKFIQEKKMKIESDVVVQEKVKINGDVMSDIFASKLDGIAIKAQSQNEI